MVDRLTKLWIRNRSDELAVGNGCTFSLERATHTVWWIERYCRLYEGASGPMVLSGCHQCGGYDLPDLTDGTDWDTDFVQENVRERAKRFAECVRKGHFIDWQYDCTMRLFGWERHSDRLRRKIRRFREAVIFVSKKNKKSPTLAALSLYMLEGDGEQGQKVYLAAKDGAQARDIAGGHVIKMVEKSPELAAECTINKSLFRVTHNPSDSWLQPLSSANETTQKSKEGLNGSVFIDEVHVVDRKFVNRISRAGISRDEPLHAEFSTAGDDPQSYGKDRRDFAVKVQSGEVENQGLFAAVYEAPQDLSDEELEANPLKYARMANPAMGHTVDAEEFLHDYQQSKGNASALAIFKMYRLNIWQSSASPFLRASDWQRCYRKFTEAEMLGRPCWAGFDLALKWDTTAFVLVFPWDDDGEQQYRILPYLWLPRERAHAMRDKVGWADYERRGFITLTDGDVTDFQLVRKSIKDLCGKFDVRTINYDDRFAESFCQQLQDEDGLSVTDFPQTPNNYNEPSFMMERLVIAGNLHHNGNAVIDWQAGNLTMKRGMPAKPDSENYKKIDGMVALIMGLAGAMSKPTGEPSGKYYESNPLEFA
jgi:phage terminase large subunit-like protein